MSSSEQLPKNEESTKHTEHVVTRRLKAPYLSGFILRIMIFLMDYMPGVTRYLFWNAGLKALRKLSIDDCPTLIPLPLPKETFGIVETKTVDGLEIFEKQKNLQQKDYYSSGFLRASDFHEAYLAKRVTPLQVCEVLINKIEESLKKCSPPLNAIIKYKRDDIIAQATASTERYANNSSLGLLDGIPIAVKDEIDVKGYETNVGTKFINYGNPATSDATIIERLREKGAIILGKTSMHEIGFGIDDIELLKISSSTNNNPFVCTPRNPYNTDYYPGGSSGGSGVAVASGLCPIAIGRDGGGSVRIPSSFCGIYGLKTTCGRFSDDGQYPLAHSVAVSGPMAASVDDLALAYYVMAGKDPKDPNTLHQPLPTLHGFHVTNKLSDLKIGVYSMWNKQVDNPAITTALNNFIDELKLRGAKIIEIKIPELEEARIAHLLTIGTELTTVAKRHKDKMHLFSCPTRSNINVMKLATASDYIVSQQVRTRIMRTLNNLFSNQVDLILTPATAITAPKIYPRALAHGEVDVTMISDIMRFVQLANFAGVPAVSVPAGYDDNNLPIGLQFIAKWYDEATLLRIAKTSEEILGNRRKKPSDKFWFGNYVQEVSENFFGES
ncbi:amidase signature enzyme [Rhizophagus irregularis]|uniref:Amidase signature enzyme n=2 Tax=Rhizophagus irregularis TaxID=588596 RepID=A0A2I1DSK8_9GLOM|nr:amidase signature domain-containing protein [Rhizophagus irregularis DAOM 181602=DAOM 197198]PKC17714.1 amidase signature enzyme [Rhizophagus irregularis]PKC75612.1 amidase signature enzyme [Rhizophagus irregularis]PKK66940.1 amidase signature enzyme [Rhizophagus irregularis]PKY12846.1 amidase signature enzyme [Rhizophagus irregularis]POG75062.1 amidase signature domain-containing protein [Rhizophagus irregularis DAOM 181602=DAOM 197198]|eukprot:XP_025181928.1 amidase signature domain-containing protein [Rhizophagus irregularis DAOM 181602=DAOM 197198]